ncbi:30S ribosomal protein S11 [Rickettsia endosymbiont of Cardiosporidium cionae]|uniref:30S ribosomal protein S11 n=1 Tax=Rickettsia endosymbiont of Cardiosporidium cionae TaxID=2777155 RepID=UPI001893CD9D|nr:30S ribosomal protein S11 [Rickettsia endosymbiont of Cardiosporidium cionae]KAF8818180.1 30S ribosomal protein S11 [Rickettsia endosymbiont of Cardiosporidium cionae]
MNILKNRTLSKRKNISLGVVHIKATFNNTIVVFSDVRGNVLTIATAGAQGFKGAKKATPYAAQVTVEKAAIGAKSCGLKTVTIKVKGAGSQRESAMRAVFNQDFIVTSIIDVSSVPHNGVRPPKRRRV